MQGRKWWSVLLYLSIIVAGILGLGIFASANSREDQNVVTVPTLYVLPTEAPSVVSQPSDTAASALVVPEADSSLSGDAEAESVVESPAIKSSVTFAPDVAVVTSAQSVKPVQQVVQPVVSDSPVTAVSFPPTAPMAQSVTNVTGSEPLAVRYDPSAQDITPRQTAATPQTVANQMVITFDPSSSEAERAAYLESIGAVVVEEIAPLSAVVVEVPSTFSEMPATPNFVTGEPNYFVSALLDLPPNDTHFSEQWGLQAMNVPLAWAATLNEPVTPAVVAVIDSGVCASHPDLEGRILPGWDFVENDSVPQDEFGHGCNVTGIIAANVDNGIGIAGVSPQALVMPLRVLDASGLGTHSAVAQAIVLAVDHGAQVINLSLGSPNPSTILEQAVNYASAHGVIVVAAAGNTGQAGVYFPAAYDNVIAVGAVDESLVRSSFSSYGPEIVALAPGQNVLTTQIDGEYRTVNGTSFAAAYVSGAVALATEQGRSLTFNGEFVRVVSETPMPTPPPVVANPTPNAFPDDLSGVTHPQIAKSSANLSSNLYALSSAWRQDQAQALELAQTFALEITGNWVAVTVTTENAQIAEAVKSSVRSWGGEITAEYDRWFDAQALISTLEDIASLPGVSLIQPIVRVFPVDDFGASSDLQNNGVEALAGSHLTQGVAASNADVWHTAGITGEGVTIAILDGFTNIAGLQASGELPTCLTELGTLQASTHGSAVAEIVHDMAPDACMILASPTSGIDMAARILELANYPVETRPKIITSSIGYYNLESGDGTGAVSNAISDAASQGVLFTQAAGNQAQYNWQGNFSDTDNDGWLNFNGDDEINGFLNVQAGDVLRVYMRWNDWPESDQDYDLWILYFDPSLGAWDYVAWSNGAQTGTQLPVEDITYVVPQAGQYGIAVENYHMTATGNHVIDIMGHNSRAYEYNMTDHSLIDPASSASVVGVAALNVTSPYNLEPYSSRGPAMGPGGSLAAGNSQPRIAGYANVDTATVPGFNGTSSATPHVAGAAALVFDAYPSYSAAQVKSFLESHAVDMGTGGYDLTYGAGRLYLGNPPTWARDGIGMYARATGDWYLRTSASPGAPDYQAVYGGSWARPLVGDWNGDGADSIGVYNSNDGNWYLRNTNSGGAPDVTVSGYGGWWGLPVTGDWDGNGTDTIGLFVPSTGEWILRNTNTFGSPDVYFTYGGSWGYPVVGDWNGDGIDTVGIYNPNDGNWYLRNTNSGGGADIVVNGYGGWWGFPIVGDWNGDNIDTISLFAYQTGEWLLRNSNSYGSPDIYFAYGGDWGTPMVGDWNGPGALTVDMMPFNQNWDAVNQSLSMVATDYSLEDLLRFALDPSTPLDATATLVPVPPTATSEPTQVKPTPQTLPQGPDSPPPLPNDAVEVTETPLPTEPPTATEAPALPTEPPVATEAPVLPTDNPPEVPTTEG